jgi:hypothetical protein
VPAEVTIAATELHLDTRTVARSSGRKLNLDRPDLASFLRGDLEYA